MGFPFGTMAAGTYGHSVCNKSPFAILSTKILVIFVEENPWYFGEKSKSLQRRVLQMGEEPRERSSALRPSQLDMKDMNKAAFCYPDWHRALCTSDPQGFEPFQAFFLGADVPSPL